jgi:formamidopyrimidine-DNA glycosylase
MPELPEVETICNNLRLGNGHPSLLGMTIHAAQVYWARTLETPSVNEFKERVRGQIIESLGRRGKFLIFTLSHDTLLFHLRMSGDLLVELNTEDVPVHHRMVLALEENLRLAFNDPRKFGRVWLVTDPQSVTGSLGPEPLDPDFTPEIFYRRLQARRRQLKPLLMDQTFLAGLGNIYTDEALFLTGIHPLTLSDSLRRDQVDLLLQNIRQVLMEGIRRNGASIDWVYRGGEFQNYFRVYGRTGEACLVCGSEIQRILVGQRSTHFCPHCQALGSQPDKV